MTQRLARFQDARWMSAAEKENVFKAWAKLMKMLASDGLPMTMPKEFSRTLYDHLHLHCGHIAHYDRSGFWSAQLGDPEAALSFMADLERHLCRLSFGVANDYADLNSAMFELAAGLRNQICAILRSADAKVARAQIVALASRAGIAPDAVASLVGAETARTRLSSAMHNTVAQPIKLAPSSSTMPTPATTSAAQACLF